MLIIMKTLTRAGILAIGVTLTLAGCSASPTALSEDDYLKLVGELDSFRDFDDSFLIERGEAVCEIIEKSIDAGLTPEEGQLQLLKAYTDQGLSAGDSGSFFAYARGAFCPEYLDAGIDG